jgi:hypothetical protein
MIQNVMFFNVLINLLIILVSLIFLHSLYNKYYECNGSTKPTQMGLMILWGIIGVYFIIDTVSHINSFSGNSDLQIPLYFLSLIALTLVSLPIVFLIIYIISGNKYIGAAVSSVFLIFSFLYIFTIFQMDQINIIDTNYGLIVSSNNDLGTIIFLSGLFIVPISMILGLLALILLRRISPFQKYKICFSLLSISVVYSFLLLITISQTGEMIIASKIFIFLGVVLGYFANFPPKLIESKYTTNFSIIE